eukprot:197731_1
MLFNVDRLSSMQQLMLVIVFFSMALIMFYTNILCSNEYTLFPQKNTHAFIPWNKTTHLIPYHPSLIVIGSVNGGTTLINHLYLFLQSFHDDTQARDTFYWTRCIPCDEHLNRTHDFHKWNVSEHNLCSQFKYLPRSPQEKIWNRLHREDTNEYKDESNTNAPQCRIKHYKSRIMQHYPSTALSHFSAERCSAYIYAPYVAKIIATLFPKTIVLYAIREKATQQYSRAKNFPKGPRVTVNSQYFDSQFNIDLDQIESDTVRNGLLPLLSTKQTDRVRDAIVSWYVSYPSIHGIRGKKASPFQSDFKDLCPYVNVLLYMKTMAVYNTKYGFSKLKIIQSEWLFADLRRSLRFIHCIVVVKNWNSNEEMKHCDAYYEGHMDQIISENHLATLMNNTFGKKEKYKYLLTDMNAFQKLSEFWSLCDKLLFELIRQYPSLTVGTQWDMTVWIKKRQEIKHSIVTNLAIVQG